ncbi:MAG: VapC toxin family PIN domain ribonuclease [Bacteroidetes bacterium 4484_249]|nr:MAG: VapC toxin family PIN domain ribonuclease [Bacteroidetes bacterium 4484_249]
MILIDTSVLISYFKGVENSAIIKFEEVLSQNINYGINNYIYQEILQGSLNEKEFNTLKSYLDNFIFYNLKKGRLSFTEAAKIYFICRKKGVTVRSTIDLLIAQTAIENNLSLLHNDNDFDNIASVIPELKIY